MSTAKRERQRQNRQLRLAADQAAAKRRATRRRIRLGGIAAVATVVVIAGIWLLQRSDDEPDTDAFEQVEQVEQVDDTDGQTSGDSADGDGDSADGDETDADAGQSTAEDIQELEAVDEVEQVEQVDETAELAEPSNPDCPATDGSGPRVIDFDSPQPMCINPEARYVAVFDTSEGEMRFELTAEETPLTVNNFVTLARWGYYDDTLLFRTDPSIDIIQGGSPHTNSASDPGPGYTIPDEPTFEVDPATGALTGPHRYQPGQLVMARSAGENSAGAQFFLTTGPNTSLLDSQGTYVVFGNTDDAGLAVAQSIIGLHEPGGALGGAPSRDVAVRSVTIEKL